LEGRVERIGYSNSEVTPIATASSSGREVGQQHEHHIEVIESSASNVVDIRSGQQAITAQRIARLPEWGTFEPFVDEHVIASFLGIKPRRVIEMARKKLIPAHPIGGQRKTWRFRVSEIDAHFTLSGEKRGSATMSLAVPVTQERKRNG
jgi:Helix-turn-helix domain